MKTEGGAVEWTNDSFKGKDWNEKHEMTASGIMKCSSKRRARNEFF